MKQKSIDEQFERRISALRAFAQKRGWTVTDLDDGSRDRQLCLVRSETQAVEVKFYRSGRIELSHELSMGEESILQHLLPWLKRNAPNSVAEGYLASDQAWAILINERREAERQEAERWIAAHFEVYHAQEDFPSYGSPSVPRWITKPAPATVKRVAGDVRAMEIQFNTSEGVLREAFAIFLRDLLAEQGATVLATVTFPPGMLNHLSAIQVFLFQPRKRKRDG
jgi:hypothetical protein